MMRGFTASLLAVFLLAAGCRSPFPSVRWSEIGDSPSEFPLTWSQLEYWAACVAKHVLGPIGAVFLVPTVYEADRFTARQERAKRFEEFYERASRFRENHPEPEAPFLLPREDLRP